MDILPECLEAEINVKAVSVAGCVPAILYREPNKLCLEFSAKNPALLAAFGQTHEVESRWSFERLFFLYVEDTAYSWYIRSPDTTDTSKTAVVRITSKSLVENRPPQGHSDPWFQLVLELYNIGSLWSDYENVINGNTISGGTVHGDRPELPSPAPEELCDQGLTVYASRLPWTLPDAMRQVVRPTTRTEDSQCVLYYFVDHTGQLKGVVRSIGEHFGALDNHYICFTQLQPTTKDSLNKSNVFTPYCDAVGEHKALETGYVDAVLDAGESILRGINPLNWLYGPEEEQKDKYFEVLAIRMNWYGRNTKRLYRFYKTGMHRIHPESQQVRARRDYSEIVFLKIVDDYNLIIRYSDKIEDYLRLTAIDLKQVVNIIIGHGRDHLTTVWGDPPSLSSSTSEIEQTQPTSSLEFKQTKIDPGLTSTIKQRYTFSQRTTVCLGLLEKHPNKVPVVVERAPGTVGSLIVKSKFVFPKEAKVSFVATYLQDYLNPALPPAHSLVLFTSEILKSDDTMGNVYKQYKDDDGFLYIMFLTPRT